MNLQKYSSFLISALLIGAGLFLVSLWLTVAKAMTYTDLRTVLTTTTATFGTLLGIITAGLMFTQGRFSELASELAEKSPNYLTNILSLERIQPIETGLLALKKTFNQLAASTAIAEEKKIYERIVTKASSMFVDFAVLLNLKLTQEGLMDTVFSASEMDSQLYGVYQKRRQNVTKEWQVFNVIKRVTDTWEAPTAFFVEKSSRVVPLQADLKSSIAILKLKEGVDKSSMSVRSEVAKKLNELNEEIGEISKRLHEDRIPQLLPQMKQASTIRGKYFYLALAFIATPLLVNLIILPQLSETTASFFQQVIPITSLLSVFGAIFLLLYIHKILNV